MGGGQPQDDRFARGMRDVPPQPRLFQTLKSLPDWIPLWSEPEMIRGRQNHEYQWDFLTSHGAVEDVILHRNNATAAATANADTTVTVHFEPSYRLTGRAKNSLTRN